MDSPPARFAFAAETRPDGPRWSPVGYRAELSPRARTGAIAAVIGVHAGLLLALLTISGKMEVAAPQSVLKVFDVRSPPPAPPPPPPRVPATKQAKAGGSAPRNIRSEATPVVAPEPQIETPPVQEVAASATPRQGTAPTQGASPVAGPGTGAGGAGNGAGSGAGGNGSGAGGGIAEPPHLATPVLSGRDFPSEMLERWPAGAQIFVRLRIDPRGYVSNCIVDRGTGVEAIDSEVCTLVYQRLRFRPALNRAGQAVAGWFGYRQTAPR